MSSSCLWIRWSCSSQVTQWRHECRVCGQASPVTLNEISHIIKAQALELWYSGAPGYLHLCSYLKYLLTSTIGTQGAKVQYVRCWMRYSPPPPSSSPSSRISWLPLCKSENAVCSHRAVFPLLLVRNNVAVYRSCMPSAHIIVELFSAFSTHLSLSLIDNASTHWSQMPLCIRSASISPVRCCESRIYMLSHAYTEQYIQSTCRLRRIKKQRVKYLVYLTAAVPHRHWCHQGSNNELKSKPKKTIMRKKRRWWWTPYQ